jgi:energy-coupling factor transport system ATP-binding protein
MILSFVESSIPLPVSLPGFKLGLSNIAVLVALETQGTRSGIIVAFVKVLAAGFVFGSPIMLAYSLGGTVLAFIGMLLVSKVLRLKVVVASMVAALLHNVGQILVAYFMLQSDVVWLLLAPLSFAGCLLGFFTGLAASAVIECFAPANDKGGTNYFSLYEKDPAEFEILNLSSGLHICFIGPNGSGKSSFAYSLLWYLRSTGVNAGLVFQDADNQIVGETLQDDCAFALEWKGKDVHEMKRLVDFYLSKVGLESRKHDSVDALSGGHKQNLAIAGILALQPQVIIFDEVSAMMDYPSRKNFLALVHQLQEEGYCVITITQLVEEAFLADEIAIFSHSNIVSYQPSAELLTNSELLETYGMRCPSYFDVLRNLTREGISVAPCATSHEFKEEICRLYAQR